jgi:hypothetical protein
MQPQTASWTGRRIACWALVLVFALAWQGRSLLRALRPPAEVVVDFFQEWASARNFFGGDPIYEPQRISSQHYLGVAPVGDAPFFIEVNAHPPTAVLVALPLAALDYPSAVLVWNILSMLALAAALGLIARQLGYALSVWSVLPVLAVLLMCWPLRSHLQQGQLAMILLLLIVAGWAAERCGRARLGGVLLGAAAAIKVFPAILFLPFLVRRQWQVVAWGSLSFVAFLVTSVVILGPASYGAYLRDVPPVVAEWRSAWNNASLPGLWNKLFDPGTKGAGVEPLMYSPTLAYVLVLVSSTLVVYLLVRLAQQAGNQVERDRTFVAAVTGMLLLAPVTWEHGFLLLLLPLAVLWSAVSTGSTQRRLLVVLSVVLMLVKPAYFYRVWHIGEFTTGARLYCSAAHVLALLSAQCYALVGLFIMTVWPRGTAQTATSAAPTNFDAIKMERRAA